MEIFMTYILPVLIFAAIGGAAGALLVGGSKLFFVETDETVGKIVEALPNANCGACGYSGCEGYANAVAKGEAPTNRCKPGGAESAKKIAAIMGTEALETVREVAFVRCNGCTGATEERYDYTGTKSCAAVERFYNGKGNCRTGCDGYGDCAAVCDNDAIRIINGVAVVNPSKCLGCGKCAKVCPNHLIVIRRADVKVDVRCSSRDIGKVTRAVCKNGCIGCKLCEKKCTSGAISVSDNHASIDYDKCSGCGACAASCPTKCITLLSVCETEKTEKAENPG